MYILSKVDETWITMLKDIIDKLLYDTENKQLLFRLQPLFIIMKTLACIYRSAAAYFLEKIVDRWFQTKVLKRWRHQVVANITDELNSIINDLSCLENALKLVYFILVHQVLIQVQSGRSKQWTRVIMQVGSETLALFFLHFNRGIEHHFLLVYF